MDRQEKKRNLQGVPRTKGESKSPAVLIRVSETAPPVLTMTSSWMVGVWGLGMESKWPTRDQGRGRLTKRPWVRSTQTGRDLADAEKETLWVGSGDGKRMTESINHYSSTDKIESFSSAIRKTRRPKKEGRPDCVVHMWPDQAGFTVVVPCVREVLKTCTGALVTLLHCLLPTLTHTATSAVVRTALSALP